MIELSNSVCSALICGEWRLISVEFLHGSNDVLRRCPECHASIKLMKEGTNGERAHFEHDKRNPECSLGDSMGKKLKYKHVSVTASSDDKDSSFQFDALLANCVDKSEVISTAELDQDLFDIVESSLSDTEKQQEINARIGQGTFRKNVVAVWGSETCAVTLVPIKAMLIASHIKAWVNCNSAEERLDGANGIMLCAHIDKLFDKHLVTFKKVGSEYRLKLNATLDKGMLRQLGVNEGDSLAIDKMSHSELGRFEDYMSHHQRIFDHLGAA